MTDNRFVWKDDDVTISTPVTAENYPTVFKAFQTIALDNGARHVGTTHPGAPFDLERFNVPGRWDQSKLQTIEAALAALTKEELDTLCTGEYSDQIDIHGRSKELTMANVMLNDFFDGWDSDV